MFIMNNEVTCGPQGGPDVDILRNPVVSNYFDWLLDTRELFPSIPTVKMTVPAGYHKVDKKWAVWRQYSVDI